MKQLVAILLTLCCASAWAQEDSVRHPSLLFPTLGASMTSAGALMTFNPVANRLQTAFHDAVHSTPHSTLSIDDQLQLLPLAAVPLLHIVGLKSKHSLGKIAWLEASSFLIGSVMVQTMKYGIRVDRPSGPGINSFPSGHSFLSFTGAELIRREYGADYPLVAVAAYTVAVLVASLRIYNDRHWIGDVLAGAGTALVCVGASYWIFE